MFASGAGAIKISFQNEYSSQTKEASRLSFKDAQMSVYILIYKSAEISHLSLCFLSMSLSLFSVCVCLSVSFFLSLFLPLSLCLFLSVSLSRCRLFVSLVVSVIVYLSTCLSHYQRDRTSLCVCFCISVY